MIRKTTQTIPLSKLHLNSGQLGWLPRNPRQWTREDMDRMIASLNEDPDFMQDRPPLVVALPDKHGHFVVFAGNERTQGEKERKAVKALDCIVYEGDFDNDPDDRLTVIRRAIKDNGHYAKNDTDIIANEWAEYADQFAAWGNPPAWDVPEEGKIGPEGFGESFNLPDGEKAPFQQISFQLSDEMAGVLSLAVKAAQYSEDFYNIEGDEQDKNGNGIAVYLIAKEWFENHLKDINSASFKEAEAGVEELRKYLRDSLKASGKKAVDVDELLGTNGMSGHYFGASQWMFPTRSAYEKMREIMPLPRDYFECKKIELRYNCLKTLQDYLQKYKADE